MRPSDILCRLCRTPYAFEDEGCEFCQPAKKHIIWPDATADHTELHGPAQQALRLLEMNMDRLERDMRNHKLKGHCEGFARAANANASALAKLVAEMRKLEQAAIRSAKDMTFEERIDIFVEMFRDLPREHQATLLARVQEIFEAPPPGALEIFSAQN